MVSGSVSLLTRQVKHTFAESALSFRPMETMGDRIRVLRTAKGMTQAELGDRLGVSRVAVSQWENGETKNIKNVTFRLLVRELGTTEDYILFGPDQGRDQSGKFRKPRSA